MRRSAAMVAIRSIWARSSTPPVGFSGELMMMSGSAATRRRSNSAMSKPKPVSSRSGMGTGTPPTKRITDS